MRYSDESPAGYDDRIPYEDAVGGLEIGMQNATGQLRLDMQETLTELRRIQRERKRITA
ncbi:MAG: hypothetical protein LBR76_04975 [Oscillospiraceae bacterium]|nr:hypothetical protein [Oscillospiraceae bacterium]